MFVTEREDWPEDERTLTDDAEYYAKYVGIISDWYASNGGGDDHNSGGRHRGGNGGGDSRKWRENSGGHGGSRENGTYYQPGRWSSNKDH